MYKYMLKSKRIFLAIEIQPQTNFVRSLEQLKNDLRNESIKWVSLNNMHLTLKFFGETHSEKIKSIILNLEDVLISKKVFEFNIEKIGVFGSSYQPKLVWAGISNNKKLKEFENEVKMNLEKIGYVNDRQNFVPHLTLGRIKQLKDKILFQEIIQKHRNLTFQKVELNKIYLYESVLERTGPIYNVIHEFPLKA